MPSDRIQGFQIPFISMSEQGTLSQKTGMWGRMRPLLSERPAPCQKSCPAGIPIARVLGYLQEKKFEEAIQSIRLENPLPSITGRVCFHPCEENCHRQNFDQSLSIRGLERFLSEYTSPKLQKREPNGKNIAVIGSGPAGLSSSYYLALLGYHVTLFEEEKALGGMLRFGIPEYRLPKEILNREIEEILSFGIEPMVGIQIGRDLSFDTIYRDYDSIFVATGAWKSQKMGVPGEEAQGVIPALHFLKELNRGRRPAIGGNVLVVGGGNSAFDAARTALRMGAQVKMAYRRSREEMPAIREEIEEAIEEGIQILFLTSPVRIVIKNKEVVGVECVRNQLTGPGEDGRAIPVPIQGSNYVSEVDTLLAAVGESPDLSIFSLGVQLKGDRLQTGEKVLEKIFLGGDLLPQPKTVIHAIQSGKEGAIRIDQYLRNGKRFEGIPWTTITAYQKGELEIQGPPVKFEELNMSYFDHQDRLIQEKLRVETRKGNFEEVSQSISEGSAIQEAKRCFQCGTCTICKNCYIFCPDFIVSIGEKVTIDYDYCKGCCICVEECPRGVMMAEIKF